MSGRINDYGYLDTPSKVRKAFHAMMSKAKNRDRIAQAKFEEPPYYMRYLQSWTTRRESEDETEHLSARTDNESQGII
jgi:predicted secreted hydrolase